MKELLPAVTDTSLAQPDQAAAERQPTPGLRHDFVAETLGLHPDELNVTTKPAQPVRQVDVNPNLFDTRRS